MIDLGLLNQWLTEFRTSSYTSNYKYIAQCAYEHGLEEAAKVCDSFAYYGEVSGIICAKVIREMKGTK